jgi:putative ABC transport system permease protein
VTDAVGAVVADAWVSGLVSVRAQIGQVLDTLLLVVTGLLGIAVVIALIGVGNTLALPVVERRPPPPGEGDGHERPDDECRRLGAPAV